MSDSHEVRELRHRLREANAQLAKRGQTIHTLRCELAEARSLVDKSERGELRRLERVVQEQDDYNAVLTEYNAVLKAENRGLREQLADRQVAHSPVGTPS